MRLSALSSRLTDKSSNVGLMPLNDGRKQSRPAEAGSIGSAGACISISILPAVHGSCTQPGGAAWPSELQQPLDAVPHAAMLARHSRLASAQLSWHDCWPLHLPLPLAVCCMPACECHVAKHLDKASSKAYADVLMYSRRTSLYLCGVNTE